MTSEICIKLRKGPEQEKVVGPLVDMLIKNGWNLDQIIFGKTEWRVPKNPSEASKRERGASYDGFPVDIAVFESKETCGDYRHLLFMIECKQPDITVGLQQLEIYLSLEPYVKLGIWANSAEKSAECLFVFRDNKGLTFPKKNHIADLPSIGEPISQQSVKLTFSDLITPSNDTLYRTFSDLLDKVVAQDSNVTRREEQLDQLCNLILLKLNSDKQGKIDPNAEITFRSLATETATGDYIRDRFSKFYTVYPDIFITQSDKELRFSDSTIHDCVEMLSTLLLLDAGVDTVSIAFQVLRSAALKQEEGQYFTPTPVIKAAIKLIDISLDDIIIDPACGTGGFLIQCLIEMKNRYPGKDKEVSKWAQLHLFGIDKDSIGIKLTKAIMQILDDGSTHCVRGDSVLVHTWATKYIHLLSNQFSNNRFSKVLTNPPFGAPLKIKYSDAKKSGLSIVDFVDAGKDIELGLAMFNRCHDLLKIGGKMCIVLPETYFFSPSYRYVRDWAKTRLKPICVANVPMEAFQGFCRAKTNLYVFEKLDPEKKGAVVAGDNVYFLNPQTCGIYKNGSTRYKVDSAGRRTSQVDNELIDMAVKYSEGVRTLVSPLSSVYEKDVLVPRYYDPQYDISFDSLKGKHAFTEISLGDLINKGIIEIIGGHGSPSNDLRNGTIPYVKVSDIRNLRININPTNLIPLELAKQFWKTKDGKSNLHGWDLISPNRASSNIGEFSIVVPGEEQVVLTKEVYVLRVLPNTECYDPFYMLWALSLKEVRTQWQRITFMQTNREDVGNRYREIRIPVPKNQQWALDVSRPFRNYFTSLADSKKEFIAETDKDAFNYIASISAFEPIDRDNDD
ncbi:MAG TPA: N-6 DNA methylase [Bacillota bacterium]|nr:N-6 DNA methylase [Bacillota bacterium]